MVNLSLVPLEDLLDEVFSRFDGFICMGVQKGTKLNRDTYFRRWDGGSATCLGLCDLLHNVIKADYNKNKEDKL